MKAFATIRKIFRRWVLRSLQPCQNMVPLMSESMDRSLGVLEWLRLRLHLLVCAWCTRYLKQIRFIRQLLREESPAYTSAAFSVLLDDDARQRISKSVVEKQKRGLPRPSPSDRSTIR